MYLTFNAILPKIRSVKESGKQILKAVRVYIKAHQEKRGKEHLQDKSTSIKMSIKAKLNPLNLNRSLLTCTYLRKDYQLRRDGRSDNYSFTF